MHVTIHLYHEICRKALKRTVFTIYQSLQTPQSRAERTHGRPGPQPIRPEEVSLSPAAAEKSRAGREESPWRGASIDDRNAAREGRQRPAVCAGGVATRVHGGWRRRRWARVGCPRAQRQRRRRCAAAMSPFPTWW